MSVLYPACFASLNTGVFGDKKKTGSSPALFTSEGVAKSIHKSVNVYFADCRVRISKRVGKYKF
jgi:hypothetical protein